MELLAIKIILLTAKWRVCLRHWCSAPVRSKVWWTPVIGRTWMTSQWRWYAYLLCTDAHLTLNTSAYTCIIWMSESMKHLYYGCNQLLNLKT